jgi:endonuclease YncB( thermonuclease family)
LARPLYRVSTHVRVTVSFARRLVALLLAFAAIGAPAREISSWAIVNEDATLRIKGKTVHLYGIHIPDGGYTCAQNRRPPVCGSRASIALDFKVKGFIRCDIRGERPERGLIGWCRVGAGRFDDGEDLSAYLLERGWAVALPDAPVEYQALEKIARNRGVGVWGFPVDRVVQ